MTHANSSHGEPKHDPTRETKQHPENPEAKKMQGQLKPLENPGPTTKHPKAELMLWWIHRMSGLTAHIPPPADSPYQELDNPSCSDSPASE